MKTDWKAINTRKAHALDIFQAGLEAVAPGRAIARHCHRRGNRLTMGRNVYDLSEYKKVLIVGGGKAGAAMAAGLESICGDWISDGIINVKYGHLAKLNHIKIVEAGHPVPDSNGEKGALAILGMAESATAEDLVICLISGGGSALMPLPAGGLSLADKQKTTGVLLACGATIHEINTIRKHLSNIKGGMLARAAGPATLVSLILSDVVGDDLDVIASGPCVPDSSTYADCMAIITGYGIKKDLPETVVNHLKAGVSGQIPETPKTGDPAFTKTGNLIIGRNMDAVNAAKSAAENLGYPTLVLSSMIEGETRDVACVHGAIAREVIKTGNPMSPPLCILSGGETTVTIKGKGLGGRNQEFALAAAMDIAGYKTITILSGGTDGTDGPTDAAGAVADGTTVARAGALDMSPRQYLAGNDAYHFFEGLGDLIKTGPTNTNVMDLRVILVS
jgi:hydroxypyruvate reductase